MSPLEQMHFYDDRYNTEMNASFGSSWQYADQYRYIISDDGRWVRIDQQMTSTSPLESGWPYSTQKIDAIARKLIPGARVVASTQYGLDEITNWTRTYKVL